MKHDKISLRRRHLMIAGLAGMAAPAGVWAAQQLSGANATSAQVVIISGQVTGPDGKPLAGATIQSASVNVTTDADGRFVFTTVSRGVSGRCPQPLACRTVHPAHRPLANRIDFASTSGQRDDAGAWRAAVNVQLG